MKTITCILMVSILTLFIPFCGKSQVLEQSIEIGDKVPDFPIFQITNSTTNILSQYEYSGKFLLIDFWATWCSPCIGSLPKMEHIQNKFKDKLKVLLVSNESKILIDNFFINNNKITNTEITIGSIYKDAILRNYFPHNTIPHYVWIDSNGIVIGITGSEEVNDQNIEKFINNRELKLSAKNDRFKVDASKPFFNELMSMPLFIDSGYYGPDKLKYRSVLTKSVEAYKASNRGNYTGRLIGSNSTLISLFKQAYEYSFESKISPIPYNRMLIEIKDREKFVYPNTWSKQQVREWLKANTFIYDLIFPDYYRGLTVDQGPDNIRKYACEVMKRNLETYTGLKSKIEERMVDCLVLKETDFTKHISSIDFGISRIFPARSGIVFNMTSVQKLIFGLQLDMQAQPPLVDDTHYKGKINIRIDALMSDVEAVNKELNKFGFNLIREPRLIKMLIITDD